MGRSSAAGNGGRGGARRVYRPIVVVRTLTSGLRQQYPRILCVVGVIIFGYFCGDIVDPERNPWTAGYEVMCDVLPV